MTMTIEQLKEQVKAQTAEAMAKAKETAEVSNLQRRLALLQSEAYQKALTMQAETENKQTTMTQLIEICKAIVAENPVTDKNTRKLKTYNGSPVFGLGKDIELLHTLATGLLYSVDDHKLAMLEATKLNLATVETFLLALGQTAYYNIKTNEIVPEVACNLEQATSAVTLLGEQLGLVLDTTMLNEMTMFKRFKSAQLRAEADKLAHEALPEDTHFTMS